MLYHGIINQNSMTESHCFSVVKHYVLRMGIVPLLPLAYISISRDLVSSMDVMNEIKDEIM